VAFCLGYDLAKCKYLGEGYEGQVLLTPDNKALKIFKNSEKAFHEYDILKKCEGSIFFPKAYVLNKNVVLREFVGGIELREYLEKYKINEKLARNLILLMFEFIKLGFTRIDTGSKHIFVQEDYSVMIIDPRKSYTKVVNAPYKLLRALERRGQLDDFLKVLVEMDPNIARYWLECYTFEYDYVTMGTRFKFSK